MEESVGKDKFGLRRGRGTIKAIGLIRMMIGAERGGGGGQGREKERKE